MLTTLFGTAVNQQVKHCTFAGIKNVAGIRILYSFLACRKGTGLTGIEKGFLTRT